MALALDGHIGANASTANITVSLVTASANDVIYLSACGNVDSGIDFSADTSGLSWTIRSANPFGTAGSTQVTAWAIAASAGTFSITTKNLLGATNWTVHAWGVSGANTASPFDGSFVPQTTANTNPSITTTNANDIIMCGFVAASFSWTIGAGFSPIDATNYQQTAYEIVSSTFSGSVGASGSWATSWADAIKQASAAGFKPAWARGSNLPVIGTGTY